ncbi:MAG: acetate--CoA ligase family protein [Betaproteobacteria bacterium]|nr:acetate--CoA ligase family protein [Betaproteobacteria bacterium]
MLDPSALGVFFKPGSVALVGASSDPRKPGNAALRNMISLGYRGKIYPLNPREESVLGLPCFKSVLDVPGPLDLCVLLVSAELTLQVARELAERKSRSNDVAAVVCMSAGFGELNTSEAGQRERELVQILKSASIRLIGPNCLGVMDTASGFNTNFDIGAYPRGPVSVLTQSGAFGNSFLLWAGSTGRVGLNKFVSIGNMADVDMAELLAFLKDDDSTRVIGIYLEGLADPRRFFRAAREVAAVKPVVLLKSGRSEKGTTAALSHTGAVAGADAIYEGALKQAGVIRARSVSEFYDTLRAFGKQPIPAGSRVCVLTHMGGPGTLCIDEISALPNLHMAEFSPETHAALKSILAPAANVGRPGGYIDMTAAHYETLHHQALDLLFRDPNIDAVIQILAPSAFLDQKLLANEVASAYAAQTGAVKPLLNVVTFGSFANELRQGLENAGLPTFDYPDSVARVAANMALYAHHRRAAAPAAAEGDSGARQRAPAAAQPIARARGEARISLLETEAYEVCRQYDIRVPPFALAHSPGEALAAAETIGYPVALKVVSAQILHKTEAGGVILGVGSPSILEQSYTRLIENARRAAPQAKGAGVLVQKMMPAAVELALGGIRDKLFGPAVMFGLGGIYVEALGRVGFRMAPLALEDAEQLIHEALPPAVIAGTRGREGLNVESIARALVCLGRLLEEQPEVDQVDLNPVLSYREGCMAVDARIIIRQSGKP